MIDVIADNVASENFEFFCQKLQLRQADIKSLENTRLVAGDCNSILLVLLPIFLVITILWS